MAVTTLSIRPSFFNFTDVVGNASQTMTSAIGSLGRSRCTIPVYYRKEWRSRGPAGTARATQDDELTSQEGPIATPTNQERPTTAPPPLPPVFDKKAAAKAEVDKGQTTALITGVISVMLGVGYLVLLQLLDTRGVNLVPPPPEAFNP